MKAAIKLMALGLVAAAPMTAQADVIDGNDSGFYVGVGVGQSKFHVTSPELEGSGNAEETGFRLLGGYQVTEWLSVEAAYYKPGKVTESEDGTSLSLDIDVLQVMARATAPLFGRVSAFGKMGFSRWDSDLMASDGFQTGRLSDNGTDYTWGVGLGAQFNDNLSGSIEFEQTKVDAPIEDLPLTWRLQFISANIKYSF